jgi:hypothetical protein
LNRIPSTARIKGSFLIPIVKALKQRRAEAQPLLREDLHHYLSDRLLTASWYPEADHVELRHVLGSLLAPHIPKVWVFLGATAARLYGQRLYRDMVVDGSPKKTLQSFPAFWSLGHSSGQLSATLERDNAAYIEMVDYPAASAETCGTIEGFYSEILKMAGALELTIAKRSCLAAGARSCRWDIVWTATS